MMNIIKNKKIPFFISGLLFIASVVLILTIGLKPGIDFTGGSLLELTFSQNRPALQDMQMAVDTLNIGSAVVQPADEDGYIIKMQFLGETEHQEVLRGIRTYFNAEGGQATEVVETSEGITIGIAQGGDTEPTQRILEDRFETIGPSISSELQARSWEAGIAVMIAIVLFVAYSFRKVTKPVSSWKYGMTAIIALVHDVVITMGVFVLLGHFYGIEIDIPFVVAMLTILGYSVNDTIVVFDRIREKLIREGRNAFAQTVNNGVVETIPRSINTSLTTLLVLVALFIFGGMSIHYFALALIIGIALGTYSSIFLASPLLVVWEQAGRRKV
ncbi:MAG: protein translocase subunit SecF [Candidatus Magasanikbacteria bacterium CG10_big_fil_rev_8_21_14_0_10_47_10]|uniref:Protein-export membrane protein SecF n=1 Tax=Candidatus Magasanikbacteria bacterium CG10_big_fil_rev_8_21_14_0_10_47_10 TaxID=1974652 RepID=A0A2H0TRV7_9BACT|nr:MAG: protein translocase subunit SecF [Candidatus Magasanikbacteria bacterium CG10_big_fil_rev_8_21_14_0_10_47_10]